MPSADYADSIQNGLISNSLRKTNLRNLRNLWILIAL